MNSSTEDISEKSQQMDTDAAVDGGGTEEGADGVAEMGRMAAHCCAKAAWRFFSEEAASFRSGSSTGSLSLRVTITTCRGHHSDSCR